jgi:hypothetical protein
MDYANLVVVHECGSEIEADLAKGALQAAGIDAMILKSFGIPVILTLRFW